MPCRTAREEGRCVLSGFRYAPSVERITEPDAVNVGYAVIHFSWTEFNVKVDRFEIHQGHAI